MRNNLTKKEIRHVPTLELAIRFNRLMLKGELLSAREITVGDARETLYIEDELRRRLVKAIGHDFYPPDRIEEKAPSNYMVSLLQKKKSKEPTGKLGPKLNFKVKIISSIGATAAMFNAKVDSKSGAILEAQNKIKELGLKKATYKIS